MFLLNIKKMIEKNNNIKEGIESNNIKDSIETGHSSEALIQGGLDLIEFLMDKVIDEIGSCNLTDECTADGDESHKVYENQKKYYESAFTFK